MARSLSRSPNRYPDWFAPHAPVTLDFADNLLTNFTKQYVEVGPPPARLMYRVIEPADYQLKISSTNWMNYHKKEFTFTFRATVPTPTNRWSSGPRGTVLLFHGYGLAQFSMLPWGLQLAQDGWRCVLVDLRGHGKSSGKRIYFGVRETNDISQLLDTLGGNGELKEPVSVVGESYGAALALRWQTVEPRVHRVVAIAPYASLSNAVLNIRHDYAAWAPKALVRAGLKKLPDVLQIQADEFDTTTVLKRKPVAALFVAGGDDAITSTNDIQTLKSLALPDSQLLIVPDATHESLTYYFADLVPSVEAWLAGHR